MKLTPLLVITNALALGLALYLYMRQGELEDQLKTRSSTSRVVESPGQSELESRILALERMRTTAAAAAPATLDEGDSSAAPMAGSDEPFAQGGAASAAGGEEEGTLTGKAMDRFRANVRIASELNREEDRIQSVVDSIDRLVQEARISSMSEAKREKIARTVLSARNRMPEIWAKMRGPEMRDMPREDRFAAVRAEFDKLRADVTTEVATFVPEADAKTIIEESVRGMGRGFGGGGSRRVSRNGGGNRAPGGR